MALFETIELEQVMRNADSAAEQMSDYAGEWAYIGNRKKQLKEVISKMEMGMMIHFATQGAWSMHEMLVQVIAKIGVVDKLCIASWSMTEDPMRAIAKMRDEGMIRELQMLFGDRMAINQPNAYQLAMQTADAVHKDRSHAKVTTLENADWQVCIIGSANYTHNRKMEAGVIFLSPVPTAFHREWISRVIAKEKPFAK